MKIIVFAHLVILMCMGNAHGMDWKILATDIPMQSIMLENKQTGIQKTMHKGDILDGGVIVEIRTNSVMIRDVTPTETKSGRLIYGLREIKVLNQERSNFMLISPEP
jgi:hypothetical protein